MTDDYETGRRTGHPDRFSIDQYLHDLDGGPMNLPHLDELWSEAAAQAAEAKARLHRAMTNAMEHLQRLDASMARAETDLKNAITAIDKATVASTGQPPPPLLLQQRDDANRRMGEIRRQMAPHHAQVAMHREGARAEVDRIWAETKRRAARFWGGLCATHPDGGLLAMRPPATPPQPSWVNDNPPASGGTS